MEARNPITEFTRMNEQEKLHFALTLFEINEAGLREQQTTELKREYVNYRFVRREFALIRQKCEGKITQEACKSELKLNKKILQFLLNHDLITKKTSHFGPHSFGISELSLRTVHKAHHDENFDHAQTVYKVGDKISGIEPGYEAIQAEDLMLFILSRYKNSKARHELIEKYEADVLAIYEDFKEHLPKYLVKLNYRLSTGNQAAPEAADIQRTEAIKNIHENAAYLGGDLAGDIAVDIVTWIVQLSKTCPTKEICCAAVLEALGNDFARLFDMKVQEQTLYPGLHINGLLNLLLKALWVNGSTPLPLAGNREKENVQNNDNYCVRPVVLEKDGIKFLSRQVRLAYFKALFIVLGDRDAIGRGQNKLLLDERIIGIDFGHAFAEKIIHKISPDFKVNDERFKNFSVFDDAPRSEIVKGLLKWAKLTDVAISEAVVKSYGENFYNNYMRTQSYAHCGLVDDYINKFNDIKKSFKNDDATSQQNIECCEYIIAKLKEIKNCMQQVPLELLEKFAHYLVIEKKEVDLIENIEKFIAACFEKTSLRSKDNTVLLNHVRILEKQIIGWNVRVDEKTKEGEPVHTLIAKFSSSDIADDAYEMLNELINKEGKTNILKMTRENARILIQYKHKDLQAIYDVFHERKIKKAFHREDYLLSKYYLNEVDLAKAIAFIGNNYLLDINVKVEQDENNKTVYQAQIRPLPEESLHPVFINYLKIKLKELNIAFQEEENCFNFEFRNIRLIPRILSATIDEAKQTLVLAQIPKTQSKVGYLCDLLNKIGEMVKQSKLNPVLLFTPPQEKTKEKPSELAFLAALERYSSPTMEFTGTELVGLLTILESRKNYLVNLIKSTDHASERKKKELIYVDQAIAICNYLKIDHVHPQTYYRPTLSLSAQ